MSGLLEVVDAHLTLGEGARPCEALHGVSLAVCPGEIVSVIGENGCGKSSLASLLCAGRLCTSGRVLVEGIDPALGEKERLDVRRLVGLVQQNPVDQIVSSTVGDEVAFGPRNLGLVGTELDARVTEALGAVGLAGFEGRDTNALSGGEQQRLALAGVLAMHPSYLVLDEATSMLDPASRRTLRELIWACARTHGIGIAQITHEPVELFESDRVVALSRGEVLWEGTPRELLLSRANIPGNPLASDALSAGMRAALELGYGTEAANTLEGILEPSEENLGCTHAALTESTATANGPVGLMGATAVSSPSAGRVRCSRSRDEALVTPEGAAAWLEEGLKDGRVSPAGVATVAQIFAGAACWTARSAEDESAACRRVPVNNASAHSLSARGLTYSYGAGEPVLRNLDFEAPAGFVTLLAGCSGCGKSTLLTLLSGLVAPDSGQVTVCGKPAAPGVCGMAFQRPESQLFLNTVYDEIALAPRCAGASEADVRPRVFEATSLIGLDGELIDRYPFELSGGQARRVALASILSLDARAYLFDEPTAGLDARGRADMHALARTLAERGLPVVVVSHDLTEWLPVVDRVACMAHGAIAWQGTAMAAEGSPEIFEEAGLELPLNLALAARLRAAAQTAEEAGHAC